MADTKPKKRSALSDALTPDEVKKAEGVMMSRQEQIDAQIAGAEGNQKSSAKPAEKQEQEKPKDANAEAARLAKQAEEGRRTAEIEKFGKDLAKLKAKGKRPSDPEWQEIVKKRDAIRSGKPISEGM